MSASALKVSLASSRSYPSNIVGSPLTCAPSSRTVAASTFPFLPSIPLFIKYLFAGSSRNSLLSAARVISVVAVNGLVMDGKVNGVWAVAFIRAARLAHPKPSSHTILPPCATATATPVAFPCSIAWRIRLRTDSKLGRTEVEPEVFGSFLACFEAGRRLPTDTDNSARKTSRRVATAIKVCSLDSWKKRSGQIFSVQLVIRMNICFVLNSAE
jgi:hypothetical protein